MMPGRTLHRLAALVCSAKTLERVVEPAIADLQKEYESAESYSRLRRVRVLVGGYAAILEVMLMCALQGPASTDEEGRVLVRTLVWSVAFVVGVTALLMLPPLLNIDHAWTWFSATTLVPQAVPLAIPIGIAFGLAFGLSRRTGMNTSKVLLLGACVASLLSFAVLAWAMPAGNQAFREITFREVEARGYDRPPMPQKGYNEMTFSELRREIARSSAEGEPRQARQAIFSFHLRFSLAVATLVLAGVLLAAQASHRGLRALTAFAACLAYWMLLYAGDLGSQRGFLMPSVGAWLPNLVLFTFAIVIASSRSSRLRGSSIPAQ